MKYYILIWLCIQCTCHYGCAQTSRVSGNLKTDTLLLTYRNLSNPTVYTEKTDTLVTQNGAFSFDFPAKKDLYMVEISNIRKKKTIKFLSIPGEQAIIENWNGEVTGSDFYQKWKPMEQKLNQLKMQSIKCKFLAYGEKAKIYQDSSKIYTDRLQKKIWNYIRNHPQNLIAAMMIKYLPGQDKESAFNQLSPSIRNGILAPYIHEQIKQHKEEVCQKNLTEERNKKFKEDEIPHRKIAEQIYSTLGKEKLEIGDYMPDLKFTDVNGKEFSFNFLRGKYVLIDVWATWCGPCRKQMPHLKKLEETLKGKNIAFVGITTDIYSYKLTWEKMVKDEKLGDLQLYAGGSREVFIKLFNITSIPRFILLDKKGKVINLKTTYPSDPATLEMIQKLEGI